MVIFIGLVVKKNNILKTINKLNIKYYENI